MLQSCEDKHIISLGSHQGSDRARRQWLQQTHVEDIHPPVHDAIEEEGKAESKDAVTQQLRVLVAADVSQASQ